MADKEFLTETDIRNFRNKVLLLPRKLQLQVNQMIEDGAKEWKIENFLKANYKGTLGVPTPPTIATYIDWYQAKKKILGITPPSRTDMAIIEKAEVEEIDDEHQTILDGATAIENKKQLLETLIKKCIQRIKKVESLQEMEGMTASLEAVLGSYVREIHSITTTQLKLSGELQEETNEVIARLVNQNLYALIVMVFKIVQKVCPDRAEQFKTEFNSALTEDKELSKLVATPEAPSGI